MLMWALIIVLEAGQKPTMYGMFENQESCIRAREALKMQRMAQGFQAPAECFEMKPDPIQAR